MAGPDIEWMDAFITACKGCRIDAIAIHLYDNTPEIVENHVNSFKKYGKPIWVTEMAQDHSPGPDA